MKNFLLAKRQSITVTLSGLASVLLVAGIVYATTISTNVSTAALTATGLSTLTSATLSSTLDVTGATTLTSATLSTTLRVTGLSTLVAGFVSTASSSVSGTFSVNNGNIGVGTSTPVAELSASGSATTTLYLHTSGTKKGSCIELVASDGTTVLRMYATTSGTTLQGTFVVEAGACK